MLWCTCTECVRVPINPECLCCKEQDICVDMLKKARMAIYVFVYDNKQSTCQACKVGLV